MLDSQEFARVLHMKLERLDLFIAHGWVMPIVRDGRPMFRDVDIARAALIVDLTDEMGVNDEGVDVVLDLLDKYYGLRVAFATLMDALDNSHGMSSLNDVRKLATSGRGGSRSVS
ncbi:chaperone modulator CbpM [Mesorhizobium sp. CAU 1741]|uniref:chaperone modulator CbpM n=1 Tax=Mesorhizobium sp. CAU 1741 TaxID=3140366 RepID=UPI00325A5087